MNQAGPTEQTTLEREAREWLIRLDGDTPLGAGETEALRAWMTQSPAHREELSRIAVFWNRANALTELAVPLQSLSPIPLPDSTTHGRWRSTVRPRLAVAGTCACVIAAVVLWWGVAPQKSGNGTYGTAVGQQQTLTLADGSSIEINTDSQVQVDYGDRLRKIRLLRGEAFFTVVPNVQRPFEVYAATGMVRAVGTAFAVSVQGSEVSVTVTKGEVAVTQGDPVSADVGSASMMGSDAVHAHISLKAGQTATIGGSASVKTQDLPPPELKRRLAWHSGYLVFSGQPLEEVVSEVNRYSPVTLEISDPKLATLAIGGRFKVGDLNAVCDALQSSFGIEVVRIDDRHIHLELPSGH